MISNPAFHNFQMDTLFDVKPPKLELVSEESIPKHINAYLIDYPQLKGILNRYVNLLSSFVNLPQSEKSYGIGIEVECENAPKITLFPWTSIKDGSLRNDGLEYITKPLEHEAVPLALSLLYTLLYSPKFRKEDVDFSWRTSIHVHLNVRDFNIEEVFKLLLLYIIFEKPLFRFSGILREKSNFCVPFKSSTLVDALKRFSNGHFSIGGLHQAWEKYSALNLSRLDTYGTVEFRHLPGDTSVQNIVKWVGLIVSLGIAAQAIDYEELLGIIKEINTTSKFDAFTRRVFNPPYNEFIVAESTKCFEEGITTCKEILTEENKENVFKVGSKMGVFLEKKLNAIERVRVKSKPGT